MSVTDVVVIGGGIAGVSTAALLADAGVSVRLVERAEIAAGASGRNSGIVQHPFDALLADLYRRTLTEYRTLADDDGAGAREAGFGLADAPAGLLYVGHDPAAAQAAAAQWSAAWPATFPEVLDGARLTRLEPALAPDLVACRLDIGYPVAPAAATVAFAALARRRGVQVVVGVAAAPVLDGGRVIGVSIDGRVEPAGAVVVAAGPWTPSIVDPGGSWMPIVRSWGVVAAIELAGAPRHGLEAIDIVIEPEDDGDPGGDGVDFSLVPAAGSSSLGSTFLPVEPDPKAWIEALRRNGSRYVPGVADAPLLGVRSCARPVSRDGRPLIGRAPWADGLWILAGHGPWGISTGPGSARLLADAILERDVRIPAAFRTDRFGAPPRAG